MSNNNISTVFFDLDGTLVDSALDFHECINQLLTARAKPAIDLDEVKMVASNGSVAMLKKAFKEPELCPKLHEEFLNLYCDNITKLTKPFEGMLELLDELDKHYIQWGIVTNKPEHLTLTLLARMHLLNRCSIVVCGDTLEKSKPSPDQLIFACDKLKVSPSECLFVGDAKVDVMAGNAAGIETVLALFGYVDPNNWQDWNANFSVKTVSELSSLLLSRAKALDLSLNTGT